MADAFSTKWRDDAVRVVVCDESPLYRRRLVVALERHADIEVMAEAADSDIALALVVQLAPDVVFLSGQLPPGGGPRLAMAVREAVPGVQLAYATDADTDIDLVRAVRAGVIGFAPREVVVDRADELAMALGAGRPVLPTTVAAAVQAEYESLRRQAQSLQQQLAPPELEPAEADVLAELAQGRSVEAVARASGRSPTTVANLARNSLDKLSRHARTEAAALHHR